MNVTDCLVRGISSKAPSVVVILNKAPERTSPSLLCAFFTIEIDAFCNVAVSNIVIVLPSAL